MSTLPLPPLPATHAPTWRYLLEPSSYTLRDGVRSRREPRDPQWRSTVDEIDRILIRHLDGSASAAEQDALGRWLKEDPANATLLRGLRDAWGISSEARHPGDDDEYDTPGELARLLSRIEASKRSPDAPPAGAGRSRPGSPWFRSPLLRVAALLAVVMGSAVLLGTPDSDFFGPRYDSHFTSTGERSTLRLRDGSTVVLGPESEARIPLRFARDSRDLELRGSALFDVAPDARRPFRVHAGGTVTRVLGTRFAIRAYRNEPVEVAVAEGRVAFGAIHDAEHGALTLSSGELARADSGGSPRRVNSAALDPVAALAEARLAFRDRPLAEIARELERWYDVEIRIPDRALATRSFTLSFQDAPLEEVLEIIGLSLGVDPHLAGGVVTLSPGESDP